MNVRILSVSNSTKEMLVDFMSNTGGASAVWVGSAPVIDREYSVELEIVKEHIRSIQMSSRVSASIRQSADMSMAVTLTAVVCKYHPDLNLLTILLDGDFIDIEHTQEFCKGDWIDIDVSKLHLYNCNF